jgi:ferredoxin
MAIRGPNPDHSALTFLPAVVLRRYRSVLKTAHRAAGSEEANLNIAVDRVNCQGHAMCQADASDLYELDDLGYTASRTAPRSPKRFVTSGARRGIVSSTGVHRHRLNSVQSAGQIGL